MKHEFPGAVPEIPVSDLTRAAAYYENSLGFNIDWGGGDGGITGISKGNCRLFLTNHAFREQHQNAAPVLIWINLHSKEEVNKLHTLWSASHAKIVSPPESKPWMLHEFTVADHDGNLLRIFYDFSRDVTPSAPRPVFTSISAQLFVADIKSSCAFYTDKLGFKADFLYGEPPFHGQVSRDHARLALRQLDEPVFAGDIRARDDLLSATITVATAEEIEQLFLGYQAAGVPFHQVLRNEPWGARTFIVVDKDGNLILFAGPGRASQDE
jgi:uncharacterized glyoxalase superfamily protein PhnB